MLKEVALVLLLCAKDEGKRKKSMGREGDGLCDTGGC